MEPRTPEFQQPDYSPLPNNQPAQADPVRQYLNEMGRYPLLSAEQVVELAKFIELGRVADDVLKEAAAGAVLLSDEQRAGYKQQVTQAHESTDIMIQSNLRLVVSIAKSHQSRGLPLLDLIQEGNIGLFRAVEKFDHRKGFKFSTYATWWVRQAINKAIADKSRIIRIPVYTAERLNGFHRAGQRLYQELHHDPSIEEIAAELDMSIADARELTYLSKTAETDSLDQSLGDEGDLTLIDTLAAEEDTEESALVALKDERVHELLANLSKREQNIITARFLRDRQYSLAEVGKEFGVTRERVRQIQVIALSKLRHLGVRSGQYDDRFEAPAQEHHRAGQGYDVRAEQAAQRAKEVPLTPARDELAALAQEEITNKSSATEPKID